MTQRIRRNAQLLIGMVHTAALPGSSGAKLSLSEIVARAVDETRVLVEAGFHGIIVENMHDAPYIGPPHPPETVAVMMRVCLAVREAAPNVLLGVQVLSQGEKEALAIAHACGAQFIRCENFVFAHVADEGLMAKAAAGPLLRYRRSLSAEHIQVFADIKKKHASHAITADLSITEAAQGARFFRADGLIVSGAATGKPVEMTHLQEARAATDLPLLVGSGVTPPQVKPLLQHADALIVGSFIKQDGVWSKPIDPRRCREIVAAQ